MDDSPSGFSVHGISQARITAVGCRFLLQEIFLTLGLNLYFLHWQGECLPPTGICKKQLDYFISLGSRNLSLVHSTESFLSCHFMCTEIHHFSLHSPSLFELIIISSVLIQDFLTKLSCFLNCSL